MFERRLEAVALLLRLGRSDERPDVCSSDLSGFGYSPPCEGSRFNLLIHPTNSASACLNVGSRLSRSCSVWADLTSVPTCALPIYQDLDIARPARDHALTC